ILPVLLVAVLLAGCGGSGAPKPPIGNGGPSHTYSGEPTQVVVTVSRDSVEPQGVFLLNAEEPQKLTVTIAKGNVYRIHRTVDFNPSQTAAAVSFQVPSNQGDEVAAVGHLDGHMYEVGWEANINAPDDIET